MKVSALKVKIFSGWRNKRKGERNVSDLRKGDRFKGKIEKERESV
jgi:hypothetical protein